MSVKNIMIVGVGGQGTLLTSRILGNLAIHTGFDVKLSEVHGMAQRGGSVVTFVRYGEQVAEGAHTPAHMPETKQLLRCSPVFPALWLPRVSQPVPGKA